MEVLNGNLYGIFNNEKNIFFDSKDELNSYIKDNNLSIDNIYIIRFLGSIYGMNDVIKIIYKDKSMICTPSLIGYYYFDVTQEKWIGTYGSLRDEYEALKKQGAVLINDIYGTIDLLNNNCYGPNEKIFKLKKKVE